MVHKIMKVFWGDGVCMLEGDFQQRLQLLVPISL